jgi:PAS domain S-box-containing protein
MITEPDKARLIALIDDLQTRLYDAEQALERAKEGGAMAHTEIPPPARGLRVHDPLFRSIVDLMHAGAVTLDNDHVILCCNDFFPDIVGIPLDRLIGSNFPDFLAERDRKGFARITGRYRTGRSSREFALCTVHGREFFLRPVGGWEQDDPGSTCCIVVADIVDLRAVEKAIRATDDRLERRVEGRTRQMQKALEELERGAEEKDREIAEKNHALRNEITRCRRLERSLNAKARALEEVNTALKVLLKQREQDRSDLEETILVNVKETILPYLGRLKKGRLNAEQASCIGILEANLERITSPLVRRMQSFDLTPKEIEVASYLKDGRTTKQIAEILGITPRAIEFHRYNIRKKLRLGEKKANLRAYLLSLADNAG